MALLRPAVSTRWRFMEDERTYILHHDITPFQWAIARPDQKSDVSSSREEGRWNSSYTLFALSIVTVWKFELCSLTIVIKITNHSEREDDKCIQLMSSSWNQKNYRLTRLDVEIINRTTDETNLKYGIPAAETLLQTAGLGHDCNLHRWVWCDVPAVNTRRVSTAGITCRSARCDRLGGAGWRTRACFWYDRKTVERKSGNLRKQVIRSRPKSNLGELRRCDSGRDDRVLSRFAAPIKPVCCFFIYLRTDGEVSPSFRGDSRLYRGRDLQRDIKATLFIFPLKVYRFTYIPYLYNLLQ